MGAYGTLEGGLLDGATWRCRQCSFGDNAYARIGQVRCSRRTYSSLILMLSSRGVSVETHCVPISSQTLPSIPRDDSEAAPDRPTGKIAQIGRVGLH
jgi:hypothetical protein